MEGEPKGNESSNGGEKRDQGAGRLFGLPGQVRFNGPGCASANAALVWGQGGCEIAPALPGDEVGQI